MKKPSVEEIKQEPGTLSKLAAALGVNLAFDLEAPRDEKEIGSIVADSEYWGATIKRFQKATPGTIDPIIKDSFQKCAQHVGAQVMFAIAEGDWMFLSKLAGVVQGDAEKKTHREAAAVLQYGLERNCGTKDNPCDAADLESWLKRKGMSYTKCYDNEVPRGLRKLCDSIGFILAKRPQGRPKNPELK